MYIYISLLTSFSCLATQEVKVSVGLKKALLRQINSKFNNNLILYNNLYILIKDL